MANKLYDETSVQAIADAIRSKNGTTTKYKIGEMAAAVNSITTGDNIDHADIPDYVKAEALEVAKKVESVRTPDSIVFVAASDAHQLDTNADIVNGNLHAGMALKALAYVLPGIDFCCYLGDYTWGASTNTIAEMKQHIAEIRHLRIQRMELRLHQPRHDAKLVFHGARHAQHGVGFQLCTGDDGVAVREPAGIRYFFQQTAFRERRFLRACIKIELRSGFFGKGKARRPVKRAQICGGKRSAGTVADDGLCAALRDQLRKRGKKDWMRRGGGMVVFQRDQVHFDADPHTRLNEIQPAERGKRLDQRLTDFGGIIGTAWRDTDF